jgi:hypothetical protein
MILELYALKFDSDPHARLWRSLDADKRADVESVERGQHDNSEEDYRDERSGEVRRRGNPKDQPPPDNPVRRV